jgi:3-dehydroquinate dehydratase type I
MVKPKICVSITAGNSFEAADIIDVVQPHGPDLIELRLDYLVSDKCLEVIRDATVLPLIATNRRRDQGGLCSLSEKKRVAALFDACDKGFDYIDLELNTDSISIVAEEALSCGVKLILSHHDLDHTPDKERLVNIMRSELNLGADICKIIGTSKNIYDNLTYLSFLGENPEVNLVCFGMGETGVMSRVFSPLFGGAFTYASAKLGLESAAGQLTIADLRAIYMILGV